MRVKKTYLWSGLAFALTIVIVVMVWMWVRAAPESVRLLPDSDAVVYVNLKPLRLANVFASLKKISHDPDYESFIQQTGFDFERDLDEVAVAVHLPSAPPAGAASAAAPETRFSWVLKGNFDRQRASTYFRRISRNTEIYRGKEIYTIPVENRMVRLAMLTGTQVAVSNLEGPQAIHKMIDRSPESGLPFIAPALVRNHYKDVPFGSLAWVIGRFGSSSGSSNLSLPGGFDLPIPAQTTWVASLRYAGALELKVQALTSSEDDARKVADMLGTLLGIFRSAQTSIGTQGPDPDVKSVFESLQVTQEGSRTILTATVPLRFIQKLAPEAPAALTNPAAQEPTNPAPQGKKREK